MQFIVQRLRESAELKLSLGPEVLEPFAALVDATRRALRDGRVGLAPAAHVLVGQPRAWSRARSTSASTRWMIPFTAVSIRAFSITCTPAFSARSTR